MKCKEDIWKDFAYQMCKELNLEIRFQKRHKHPGDKPISILDIGKILTSTNGYSYYYKIYFRKLTSWKNVVDVICTYRRLPDGSNNLFFMLNVPVYNVSTETLVELELKGFTDLLKTFNRI